MAAPERPIQPTARHSGTSLAPPPWEYGEPGAALFGPTLQVAAERSPAGPGAPDYRSLAGDPDFRELRRRTLRFAVPATALFMANYLLFVLLSAFAPGFMGTPVLGAVNAGMLIGLFQFVSTMLVVGAYCHFARTKVDPLVEHIRDEVDGR